MAKKKVKKMVLKVWAHEWTQCVDGMKGDLETEGCSSRAVWLFHTKLKADVRFANLEKAKHLRITVEEL